MLGIIPKPIKKAPKWHDISLYVGLGSIIAVVLAYAVMFYFENKISDTLWNLEESVAQVGTKEERTSEAKALLTAGRIDDFSKLLNEHRITSNFLVFLEENCHPKIWYTELELNHNEDQVIFSGQTDGFEILAEQLLIFKEQDFVEEITISDLAIGKNGETKFIFSLSINPEMYK